jgi:hypothetical protein
VEDTEGAFSFEDNGDGIIRWSVWDQRLFHMARLGVFCVNWNYYLFEPGYSYFECKESLVPLQAALWGQA